MNDFFYDSDKEHLLKMIRESDDLVEKLNKDVSMFLNSLDDLNKTIKHVLDILNNNKNREKDN